MSRKMHIIPSLTMSLVLMTCVITKANDNSNNTNILINENATATSHTDGATTLTSIEATTNENTTTTLFSFHPDNRSVSRKPEVLFQSFPDNKYLRRLYPTSDYRPTPSN